MPRQGKLKNGARLQLEVLENRDCPSTLYTGTLVAGSGASLGQANTSENVFVAPVGAFNAGTIFVGYSTSAGVFVTSSTNRGQSFGTPVEVAAATSVSEVEVAVDSLGNVFTAWTVGTTSGGGGFGGGSTAYTGYISESTDSGATWSATPDNLGAIQAGISGDGGIHLATDDPWIYATSSTGGGTLYTINLNNGFGTVVDTYYNTNSSGVPVSKNYASVEVDTDQASPDYGYVYVVQDNPTLDMYYSTDNGATFTNIPLADSGLLAVSMSNEGSGYTSQPTLTWSGGAGGNLADIVATASIGTAGGGFGGFGGGSKGKITGISITNNGGVWTTPPTLTISGGGGSGATANVTVTGDSSLSIDYSNYSASFGPDGDYIFGAGSNSSAGSTSAFLFDVNPADATFGNASVITVAACSSSQGRNLVPDGLGNVIDLYETGSQVGFEVSQNLGVSFTSYAPVGTASTGNAAENPVFSDIDIVYQTTSGIYLNVYDSDLLSDLGFSTEPPATSGRDATFPVVVTAAGLPTGTSVSVTLSISSGTLYDGALTATNTASQIMTTTDTNGDATFTGLSIDALGTYTLTATVGSGTTAVTATSSAIIVSPGTLAALSFTTKPLSGPVTAGSDDVGTVAVTATDSFGNAVSGQTVSLAVSSGTIQSGSTLATTDSSGVATFTLLTVETAGTFTFTAAAVGASSVTATSSSFVIGPAAPATIAFEAGTGYGPAATAFAGAAWSSPVGVLVEDTYGNKVLDGTSVAIAVSTSGVQLFQGNTGSSSIQASTVAGVATFTGLSLQKTGTFTLTATTAALSATSKSFVITAGASQLAFVQQPGSTAAGSVISPSVSVLVADNFGNPKAGTAVSIQTSSTPALSSGTLTVTTSASGLAVFSNLVENKVGTYTLSATSSGLSSVTSGSFVVGISAATETMTFTTEPVVGPTKAGATLNTVVITIADKYGNPAAGSTVTLALSSGTVSTGNLTATTGSSGTAGFSGLSVQKIGTYFLTATSGSLTAKSTNFVISAGSAGQSFFSFVIQPTNVAAGSIVSPSVSVQVADSFGNPLAGVSVSIQTSSGATLSAGTLKVATNAAGLAVFSNLVENLAGTYSLTASAPAAGLGSITSNPFTIGLAQTTEAITFLSQPSVGPTKAGSSLNTVTAKVADKFGNPVANDAVTLSISAPGTLTAGNVTATTGSDGTVSFSGLSVQKSGTFTLTATAGTIAKKSTGFVIAAGTAQQFAFVTQPVNGLAGSTISPAVSVSVTDPYGNDVAGIPVTLATGAAPLSGTTTVVSNSAGLATFASLAEHTVGTYTLTATGPSGLSAASNQFVVSLSPALEKMTFTMQPTATVAGNAMSGSVVVKIADKYGNLAIGTTVNLAITPGANTPGSPAVLNAGNVTAVTDATGQATFSGLTVDKSGTFTVTASSTGLISAVSGKFAISASTPAALALTGQPQNTSAGKNVSAVNVQVVDEFGNACLIAGVPVTMSIASPANPTATLTGTTTATTNAKGVAVFNALSETSVGTSYTLTASASTLGLADSSPSSPFTVSAGAAKTLVFEDLPLSTTAGSSLNPSGVVLQLTDSYGNPVPNIAVSVGAAPGTLSAGFAPLLTDSNGLVTFSNLTENKVGSYTLTAAVSAAVRASAPFTISPAAAYGLSFALQPTTTRADATINNVTVQIVDRYGNAVSSGGFISLALVAPSTSTATLGGTTSLPAGASGNAVFNTLQVQTVGAYSLVASDAGDGFVAATSKSFTIISGTATSMAFLTQPASGQFINSALAASTGPVIVQLYDQFGNLATQAYTPIVITITNLTTGATSTRTALTNAQGKATFNLLLALAGTYELTATSVPVITASELTATPFDSINSNTFVVTQATQRWY